MAIFFLCPFFAVVMLSAPGADLATKAVELNRRLLIVDTHVDTPMLADEHPGWRLHERHTEGHVDLPRMLESGMDAPFMVVYTPSKLAPQDAVLHAFKICDTIHGWAEAYPDRLAIARSPAEVLQAKADRKIGMVLCMENGSPIPPGRLDLLRNYHRLGVRYLGLAHFRSNHLCDSATDEPIHGGVSPFGRQVIEESNRLGIMLDVSHVSDDSVRDYLKYSRAPIIASHSNARARCDHPRNLPDVLLRRIASGGGVIQLNFAAQYVSEAFRKQHAERKAAREKREQEIEAKYAGEDEKIRREKENQRENETPLQPPPLDEWFAQLKYIVELVGIDHVGLGSDFDGVGTMPAGIVDVTSLAITTEGLLSRGWSEENLAKFYGGNVLRTWGKVDAVAREMTSGTR